MTTRVLVPSGVLGLSFDAEAFEAGLARAPDIICIDGGSTDSGPFYLGTGTSKYSAAVCRADWRQLMVGRAQAQVPLVIGSCGTCGTDSMVDWMFELTASIAAELGQSLKVARLYSEQRPNDIATAIEAGLVQPLDPAPDIDTAKIHSLTHIVALAGAETIQEALETGADIILAGRTTDTATIAALPLMRGNSLGACWHGAKIAECGAFCSSNPSSGVILLEVDESGFTVEAMGREAVCTPESVSAHMLYENADPFHLHEPGGYLDVSYATYHDLGSGRVRVENATWVPEPYTVKLEGAACAGYQTTLLAVIRDPRYVAAAPRWAQMFETEGIALIKKTFGQKSDAVTLDIRLIGLNAALGDLERENGQPTEVGVLVIITAETQNCATECAQLLNPLLLHMPLSEQEPLPTFAFPYSPAHTERGPLYEFALNHVLHLSKPPKIASQEAGDQEGASSQLLSSQLFRLKVDEMKYG